MITIAVLVPVLLSLPFFGYTWNLFMHIFGAILLMGNVIVTAVWASLARRDGRPDTARFASRGIMLTDVILTTPGAVLVLANGGILGTPYFKTMAPWILVSLVLYLISASIWLWALIPRQRKMLEIAEAAASPGTVPEQWSAYMRSWFRLGGIASLLLVVTLVMMVAKPPLW
jgi:uncharacterized membrane protein